MTYFNLCKCLFFFILYLVGYNWLGQTTLHYYSLGTRCHHGIWLTICIWTVIGIPVLPVEGNHTILFWGMLLCVFFYFLYLSLCPSKTESSNWVLWGPELPWALCCGCLIGCVIHKRTTVYCAVLAMETSECCLSIFPREQTAKYLYRLQFCILLYACTMKLCIFNGSSALNSS